MRLVSYPQTINAPVGEFVSNRGTSVTDVKVNELVQSAEFRTGLDVRIPGVGNKDATGNGLSVFAGFGGVGPLNPKHGVSYAYVFGRAVMSFSKNQDRRPVFLDPAIQDNKPVPPSASGVYVISTPSNRDVYTMGIGIDAVDVLKKLLGRTPPPAPPKP